MPDAANFPSRTWTRIVRNAEKNISPVPASRPFAQGDSRLRKLVCGYLGAYRGVRCHEDQVLVTSGGQQGLYLAARVLRAFTDQLFIEDPGYLGARDAFRACGFRLQPVPVDDAGARLEPGLLSSLKGPQAFYLTPSHQFPLGSMLDLERRIRILDWVKRNDG